MEEFLTYYAKNKERMKIIQRKYYENNKEKMLEYSKKQYQENKEKLQQYQKQKSKIFENAEKKQANYAYCKSSEFNRF